MREKYVYVSIFLPPGVRSHTHGVNIKMISKKFKQ